MVGCPSSGFARWQLSLCEVRHQPGRAASQVCAFPSPPRIESLAEFAIRAAKPVAVVPRLSHHVAQEPAPICRRHRWPTNRSAAEAQAASQRSAGRSRGRAPCRPAPPTSSCRRASADQQQHTLVERQEVTGEANRWIDAGGAAEAGQPVHAMGFEMVGLRRRFHAGMIASLRPRRLTVTALRHS